MKKFTITLAIIFLAAAAFALDIRPANQLTVAWDPVVVETDQVVEYTVFVKQAVEGAVEISAGDPTEEVNYIVTFPSEGVWYIGVSASKYQMISDPDGGPDIRVDSGESPIAWSSDPNYASNGNTFAGAFLEIPSAPIGLLAP